MELKNEKKIIYIIIAIFALLFICQGITSTSATRRANKEVRNIRAELEAERSETKRCRDELKSANDSIRGYEKELSIYIKTIDDCRSELGTIADGLNNDTNELSDIIQNLKRLSGGIKNLEDILYNRNSSSDSINSIYNEEDRGDK